MTDKIDETNKIDETAEINKVAETAETNKIQPKRKRKSQGWRTHVRRLKQAARKTGGAPR